MNTREKKRGRTGRSALTYLAGFYHYFQIFTKGPAFRRWSQSPKLTATKLSLPGGKLHVVHL